jgi:putative phosphoesterase
MADIMTTLGVVADTHVPDRVPELNPQIISIFRQVGVAAILHAGDVIVPHVLEELEQVAPVHAVRGNRDFLYLRNLPLRVQLKINGVSIGMAHGHGTFSRYMIDKVQRSIYGRLYEKYLQRMLQTFPDVDVIVFGHIHEPFNLHRGGRLLFNPGSPSFPWPRGSPGTFGLLHLEGGKEPWGEIIKLG